jgi:hypothetical protein
MYPLHPLAPPVQFLGVLSIIYVAMHPNSPFQSLSLYNQSLIVFLAVNCHCMPLYVTICPFWSLAMQYVCHMPTATKCPGQSITYKLIACLWHTWHAACITFHAIHNKGYAYVRLLSAQRPFARCIL